MPADADLLCDYYLNDKQKQIDSTNKQEESIDEDSYQFEQFNNTTSDSMEILKTKFTSFKTSPISHYETTSATNSELANNFIKNTAWLDLQWCKIRKTGIGLLNLGNNCYLNATLQCLAYTPPLSQWLVFRPHSPMCKFKQLKGFCSLCEVEKIIYDIFNSCNGFAKPNSLCFNIKKISNVFGVGTQEDASEFFTTLLESMAKSIKFAINLDLKQSNPAKKTILDDIFSFQFRSRITCSNCGKLSDTYENTNTWPVDVKYVQDIRKGMIHFLREEVLDGDNRYNCEKCNKKVKATKKYSLKTAPNILVVHLKRFDFTYAGKLSHFVTYPEILNLKSFMSENSDQQRTLNNSLDNEQNLKNTSYKLYGVLVHLGYTSHSGHYYSYVRGPNDVWYKADDQQISTVQSQDALGQNAYILFYNRISNTTNMTQQLPLIKKDYFQTNLNQPSVTLKTTPQSCSNSLISTNESIQVNIPTLNNDFKPIEPSITTTLSTSTPIFNKFKSTFVELNLETVTKQSDSIETTNSNDNSAKTLNYDQVLKIKKYNKRNLKLQNKEIKLAELKKTKTDDSKKHRKQIRKLKKQIKKIKLKIEKSEKRNKKDSNLSDDDTDDDEQEDNESDRTQIDNKTTNSLSLLKQYNSSSSSSSSSAESSPFSSPKSHSRSSISSIRSLSSDSLSATSSQSNKSLDSESLKRKLNETLEPVKTDLDKSDIKIEDLKAKTNDSSDSNENFKRLRYDDNNSKIINRPEFDSNSSLKSFNSNGNKSTYNHNSTTNYKYNNYNKNNNHNSWKNNNKYKYSSPYHYNNSNHYNNYNKANKPYYNFSRY